ncbi:O-antigen ligase family protein [Roseimaritima ulvae]|uniref:O-Antigen ligase n=1 Tax=Roseimaritima ulvae TaxID=980254 RepID=A0A5B9QVH2_9BACT|nr:O-antigen ligase family protein [Roseimaritima ulvae]QEG41899.1 O-Antigen ligase [Roseimaritima ulvae]
MSSTVSHPPIAQAFRPLWVLIAAVLLTLLAMTAMGTDRGWMVFAGCAAIPLAWCSLRYPQFVIAFTIFLLFTNAPVVAFKFHGLPRVAALLGPPAALVSVWLFQLIFRRESLVFPAAWPWALAFLGVEVISAILCRYPGIAIDVLKSHLIEGMGLFLIVCNLVRTRKCFQQVVVALLLAGSFLGGLSLWQQATHTHRRDYGGFAQVPMEGKGFETGDQKRQRRSAGPLGEQNRYAQNMLMLIPLAVLPIASARRRWHKAAYLLAALLISAGCILTFSRGAAVAFVMLVMVMKLTGYIRTRHLAMLTVASLLFLLAFPQLASRMDSVGTLLGYLRGDTRSQTEELDGAITGRATSMLAALRVTADYPLIGVGPGNFPLYNRQYAKVGGFRAHEEDRAAHCLYLHIGAEFGLLGLGLFLGMIAATLLNLHRVWKTHHEQDPVLAGWAAGFAMALFAYLLTGLFLHFSFIRFFWLILALASCIPLLAARESAERTSPPALGGTV